MRQFTLVNFTRKLMMKGGKKKNQLIVTSLLQSTKMIKYILLRARHCLLCCILNMTCKKKFKQDMATFAFSHNIVAVCIFMLVYL